MDRRLQAFLDQPAIPAELSRLRRDGRPEPSSSTVQNDKPPAKSNAVIGKGKGTVIPPNFRRRGRNIRGKRPATGRTIYGNKSSHGSTTDSRRVIAELEQFRCGDVVGSDGRTYKANYEKAPDVGQKQKRKK